MPTPVPRFAGLRHRPTSDGGKMVTASHGPQATGTTDTDVTVSRATLGGLGAIDADGHFLEPDSMWMEYLPRRFHEMRPTSQLDSLGQWRRVIGGETLPRFPAVPV